MAKLSEILADVEGYVSSHYPEYMNFINDRSVEYARVSESERDRWWNFWYSAIRSSTEYVCESIWRDAENDVGLTYVIFVRDVVVDLLEERFRGSDVYINSVITDIAGESSYIYAVRGGTAGEGERGSEDEAEEGDIQSKILNLIESVDWRALSVAYEEDKGFHLRALGTYHLEMLSRPDTFINQVWKEYRSWARENGLSLDVTHTNIRAFLAARWGLHYPTDADVKVDEGRMVTVTVARPGEPFAIGLGFDDSWNIIKEDMQHIWNSFVRRYDVLKSFDWKTYFMKQVQDIVDHFVHIIDVDPIYMACCLLDTGLTLERYLNPRLLGAIGRILEILTYSPYIGLSFGFDFMKAINATLSFMIRSGWIIFLKFTVFNAVSSIWYKIDRFLYELGTCITGPGINRDWCKGWMAFLRCVPLMDFLYFLYNKLTGIKNSILAFYFNLLDDLKFREWHFLEHLRGITRNAININIINNWRTYFNKLLTIADALALCISSADVQDYKGRFRQYREPIIPPPGGIPEDEEHIHTSGRIPSEHHDVARQRSRRSSFYYSPVGISADDMVNMPVDSVIATVVPNELYRRLVEWYNFVQEHVHTESKDECDRRLITGLFKLMEDLYE